MKEELLHFLWQHKRLPSLQLKTGNNESVEILHFGNYNNSSGPDFSEAKIRLNGLIWAGSIEMHLNASDWYKHKHHHDKNYDNVILHVVWKNDCNVEINGATLPCVELSNYIDAKIVLRYENWMKSPHQIVCYPYQTENFNQNFIWMRDRLIVERLAHKISHFGKIRNKRNILFELFCTAFGGKTNKIPFQMYANLVDINLMQRWKTNTKKKTAYLYGLSSLLEEEIVIAGYQPLFKLLQNQHNINPLEKNIWKNGAVRPQNQPKKRMLELIQMITHHELLFLSGENEFETYKSKVQTVLSTIQQHQKLSHFMVNNLLVNAFIPFAFYYGKHHNETNWIENAIDWLYEVPAEKNKIVAQYKQKGVEIQTAADSQALLELFRHYCVPKKCLSCTVGKQMLNRCD